MIHFVVHEEGDSVGTVVVEGVKKGARLTGWVMEQDTTMTLPNLCCRPFSLTRSSSECFTLFSKFE